MGRDILIRNNILFFWDNCNYTSLPKDASLISEKDWKNIIGNPILDKDGNVTKTFEELEKEYIEKMGWNYGGINEYAKS